jgi:hypothetical protein
VIDRRAEDRTTVYADVLALIGRASTWALAMRPIAAFSPARDLPDPPTDEELTAAEQALERLGTSAARERYRAWRVALWQLLDTDEALDRYAENPDGAQAQELWRLLWFEYRPQAELRRKELSRVLIRELVDDE